MKICLLDMESCLQETDVDEDILVIKSEQVQVVKDVILGTVGIPI